jgi:hypothetical protein
VSGQLIEQAPLCNGETTEYRELLSKLTSLRACTLALVTRHLHEFYRKRPVASVISVYLDSYLH